jgi:hypothetical protein
MSEPTDASSPVVYWSDYGWEGPCECRVKVCGEDGDCPACRRLDTYDGCPEQGFGCAWMNEPCDCCTPDQRAIAQGAWRRIGVEPYVPASSHSRESGESRG